MQLNELTGFKDQDIYMQLKIQVKVLVKAQMSYQLCRCIKIQSKRSCPVWSLLSTALNTPDPDNSAIISRGNVSIFLQKMNGHSSMG